MASLDAETIARLLAKDNEPKRRGGGPRKKKDVRDTDTWFDLEHDIKTSCEVSDHEDRVNAYEGFRDDDQRVHALNRKRVTAVVNDTRMCRFCFLSGAAPLDSGA
jgi:hypothetical protein